MHVASISNEIFLIVKNENKQYTAVDCQRMVSIIKYISNNLDEQISLKKIAGVACKTKQSFGSFF